MERFIETQTDHYLHYLERDDIFWLETPDGEQFNLMEDGSWVNDETGMKLTIHQLAKRAAEQEALA